MLPRALMRSTNKLKILIGSLFFISSLSSCQTEDVASTAAAVATPPIPTASAVGTPIPSTGSLYSLSVGSGPVAIGFLGIRRDDSAKREADREYRDGAALAINLLGGTLVRSLMQESMNKPEAIRQSTKDLAGKGVAMILTTAQGHELDEMRAALPTATIPIVAFTEGSKATFATNHVFGFLSSPADSLVEGATYAMAEGGRRPVILADTPHDMMLAEVIAAKLKDFGTKATILNVANATGAKDQAAWQGSDIVLLMPEVRNAASVLRLYTGGQSVVKKRHLVASTAQTPADFADPALTTAIVCRYDHNLGERIGQKYLSIYGMPASQATGYGFDAMAMAIALLTQSQNGQISLAQMTNSSGFAGVMGLFRFTEDGTVQRNCDIFKAANGRLIFLQRAPTSF